MTHRVGSVGQGHEGSWRHHAEQRRGRQHAEHELGAPATRCTAAAARSRGPRGRRQEEALDRAGDAKHAAVEQQLCARGHAQQQAAQGSMAGGEVPHENTAAKFCIRQGQAVRFRVQGYLCYVALYSALDSFRCSRINMMCGSGLASIAASPLIMLE